MRNGVDEILKRGTPRHPKVSDLAAAIKKEIYAAVGLLELLWHFTAEFAARGDIGRHTDGAIAKAIHWRGNPTFLIKALVDSKWLDTCEICRLAIHDWPQHADDATHMKLARAKEFFCDGTPPSLKRLPASEKEAAVRFYAESVRTEHTHKAHSGEGLGYGLGKGGGGEGEGAHTEFDEQWQEFKRKYGELRADFIEEDFLWAHHIWVVLDFEQRAASIAGIDARITAGTWSDPQFIPKPEKYLREDRKRKVIQRASPKKRSVMEGV